VLFFSQTYVLLPVFLMKFICKIGSRRSSRYSWNIVERGVTYKHKTQTHTCWYIFVGRQHWHLWYAEMSMYLNLNVATDAVFFHLVYSFFIYTQRKKFSTPMFFWNDKWYDKYHEITDQIISRTEWWPVRTLQWL